MQNISRIDSSSRRWPKAPSGTDPMSAVQLDVIGATAASEVGVWRSLGASARHIASSIAVRLLGLEDGEAIEPNTDAPRRNDSAVRASVDREIAQRQSEAGPFAFEIRVLAANGDVRWLDVRGTVVHQAIGVAHACGTVLDVTHLKKQDLHRELLLATLSHELRNPLTAIQIGAGLLLRRGQLDENDSTTVQRVLSSARRIAATIDEVLDFTCVRSTDTSPPHAAAERAAY